MAKPFPEEFRQDVIAAARSTHGPLSHVAKAYGISQSCLHKWLARDAAERAGGSDVAGNAETVEMKALRATIKAQKLEIEVLRRAAAYFARDALPK